MIGVKKNAFRTEGTSLKDTIILSLNIQTTAGAYYLAGNIRAHI